MTAATQPQVDFAGAKQVPFNDVLTRLGLKQGVEKGDEIVLVCPLCGKPDEKKTSFGWNQKKGTFHCFACKKSGDLITFVSLKKGIKLREAAMWLLAEDQPASEEDPESKALRACAHYLKELFGNEEDTVAVLRRHMQ